MDETEENEERERWFNRNKQEPLKIMDMSLADKQAIENEEMERWFSDKKNKTEELEQF